MSESSTKPAVPQVLPLVIAFLRKPGNERGGVLHCVLDDGNYDTGSVAYALNLAHQRQDVDAIVLCQLLAKMSRTQRRKLANQAHATPRSG